MTASADLFDGLAAFLGGQRDALRHISAYVRKHCALDGGFGLILAPFRASYRSAPVVAGTALRCAAAAADAMAEKIGLLGARWATAEYRNQAFVRDLLQQMEELTRRLEAAPTRRRNTDPDLPDDELRRLLDQEAARQATMESKIAQLQREIEEADAGVRAILAAEDAERAKLEDMRAEWAQYAAPDGPATASTRDGIGGLGTLFKLPWPDRETLAGAVPTPPAGIVRAVADPVAELTAPVPTTGLEALVPGSDSAEADADWLCEALFGFNPVTEWAAKPFAGNWEALDVAAQAWHASARAVRAVIRNVEAVPDQLRDQWVGAGQAAFELQLAEFARELGHYPDAAEGVAERLEQFSEIVRAAGGAVGAAAAYVRALAVRLAGELGRADDDGQAGRAGTLRLVATAGDAATAMPAADVDWSPASDTASIATRVMEVAEHLVGYAEAARGAVADLKRSWDTLFTLTSQINRTPGAEDLGGAGGIGHGPGGARAVGEPRVAEEIGG
jgi:uncharacterized protein YukE